MQDELTSQRPLSLSDSGTPTPRTYNNESTRNSVASQPAQWAVDEETELDTRPNSATSRTFGSWGRNVQAQPKSAPLSSQLSALVWNFEQSQIASDASQDFIAVSSQATQSFANGASGEQKSIILTGYKRASWWMQFRILSGRAFKNLYRNPMLMLAHYAISFILASMPLGS